MVLNKSDITVVWIRKNDPNPKCFDTDTYSVDIDTDLFSINFPFTIISKDSITAFNEDNTRHVDVMLV